MNPNQTRTGRSLLLATAVAVALAGAAQADVLWQDDAPLGASSVTAGGLIVTNVTTGPAIDIAHPSAGLVDHGSASKYSNIHPSAGNPVITSANYGQPFSFTVDYFVPADTVMTDADTFYLQLLFNAGPDQVAFSGGFITAAAASGGWQTITVTGSVPTIDTLGNPVTSVTPLFVFADDGFGATTNPNPGTSAYIDNIKFGVGSTSASETLWKDDAPLSASSVAAGGLIVTNVTTGPAIDAAHPSAGDVDHGSASKYSNIHPSAGSPVITSANYGQPFSFTVDYFVPVGTAMSDPDTFYLQLLFNPGLNQVAFSGGFVTAAAAGTGWKTITVSGTVPAVDTLGNPIDTLTPLFVFADDGFGGTTNPTPGTSVYIDNISLNVSYTIPTVSINSIQYASGTVTINYNTSFSEPGAEGVDVYTSDNLTSWSADGNEPAVGTNLELTRTSGDPKRFYILVKPGYTGPPISP